MPITILEKASALTATGQVDGTDHVIACANGDGTNEAVGVGTRIYRVYGGKSGPYGQSWTTVDPSTAIYGTSGGLFEVVIPQAQGKVQIINVSGVNPPY